MQLLRLEVQNWVHHRKRVCEFTRGLVAILGENGSGKSSLFGAISWLLTGENLITAQKPKTYRSTPKMMSRRLRGLSLSTTATLP